MDAFGAFFRALAEGFGLWKQSSDPEVIRKAKLQDIEGKLAAERKKRDELLIEKITPENEEKHAVALGVVSNSIIGLREQKRALER